MSVKTYRKIKRLKVKDLTSLGTLNQRIKLKLNLEILKI